MEKISRSHFQLSRVFHLAFFVIGLAIGITASLYYKTVFILLQRTITNSSMISTPLLLVLPSQPPSEPPPLLSPPPPPAFKPILLHEMDDNGVFFRALSPPPRRRGPPVSLVPKVAFMFLTKGPLPLGPLWEVFFKGHEGFYTIYVHPNPLYVDSIPESSVFYKRRIPSQPVHWGQITMIDAERRLLANALLDPSNQRFVLLSESCVPLFNFTTTYNYLTNSTTSFTGSFDDPRKVGRGRYNRDMFPKISISQWRKGSQWFEVTRKVALDIVSDTKYYPVFLEHCKPPCYVDEHYFPTLINIVRPEENSNRSITWVDWSRSGPHPGRFGRNEVSDEFLNRIRFGRNCTYNGNITTSLCFLFARKFLPNTLQPLLQLLPNYFLPNNGSLLL